MSTISAEETAEAMDRFEAGLVKGRVDTRVLRTTSGKRVILSSDVLFQCVRSVDPLQEAYLEQSRITDKDVDKALSDKTELVVLRYAAPLLASV